MIRYFNKVNDQNLHNPAGLFATFDRGATGNSLHCVLCVLFVIALLLFFHVKSGENLIVELFVDGVIGTGLINLVLQYFLEELAGYIIVFEHRQHDLQQVALHHHQLQDLHHELAQSLPPHRLFQLDLVAVQHVIVVVHVKPDKPHRYIKSWKDVFCVRTQLVT